MTSFCKSCPVLVLPVSSYKKKLAPGYIYYFRPSLPSLYYFAGTPYLLLPYFLAEPAFELSVCFMYHTQVSHHMTISHRNPASTF